MRRFSWFLILLVLLKLGMGTAVAMHLGSATGASQRLALPPCHDSMAQHQIHQSHPDRPPAGQATDPLAAQDPLPSQGATCSDCQLCCAFGLTMFSLSLPQAAPASTPQSLSPSWNSQSLRPELRPPLV